LFFYLSDFYRQTAFQNAPRLFWRIARTGGFSIILAIIAFYLFPNFFMLTPKTNLIVLGISFSIFAFGFRILLLRTISQTRAKLFILGASPLRGEIERHITEHPFFGYEIIEWFEEPTIETLRGIRPILINDESAHLVVAPHITKNPEIAAEMYDLLSENISINELLNVYADLFAKLPLELLDADWFVNHIVTRRPLYDNAKRGVDIVIGLILGIILLPLGILLALLVKISSRGPVFYARERAGYKGNAFKLYKFRTMHENADATGPLWTEANDARITTFGNLLRKTHLDEIPQLINVLKGDISFTGPRPERVELAEQYRSFTHYEMRHIVKPGITGWAQINYRPSASFEEAYEKLKFDLFYVQNRSFFLDTLIMIRTLKHFIFSR
jgi:exopolysaccharide biosynthesis polyprenyl glycosylphosphotransferase